MKIQAVIFDLDGVICFTDEYHYLAWKEMADGLGVYFDREINNRLRGVSRMESLEIILERYDGPTLTDEQKTALATEKNEIYRRLLANMTLADLPSEVKETLDALRAKGFKLAIGSSSKNAPFILSRIGLSDYFDAVADGNCITRSKPDPEVFETAAKMLRTPPEHCLVVEDAVSGAEAGHAGGFTVACVGDASHVGAGDYNLNNIKELVDIISETRRITMENKLPTNCNQCPNGCPADDLSCNKGKAYFERLKNGEETVLPPSDNPLVQLLASCAKVAEHKSVKMRQHGADESAMFKCLSAEEQTQLQDLLSKLQKTWKEDHERHHKGHKD